MVTGLLASAVAALSSIFGVIVGLALIASLIAVLELTVPAEIERTIRNTVITTDFKEVLDGSGLLTNAGEALAEEIAHRVLSPQERENAGLNRIRRGVWKMVFITERLCRVLRGIST